MQIRSAVLAGAAALALVPLAACSPAQSHDRTIVTALFPLAWASERVAGDGWQVENLTSPGAEPHDLELSIQQVALLGEAPLVVVEHGLQPAVDEAVEEHASGTVLDAAEVVDLEPVDDSHEGHAHDHGDTDPHFWLDPTRMARLTDAVADRLGEIDPDHAQEYAERAERTRADLLDLDEELRTGLAGCERTTVVVNHDAFGYLERYGLHVEPILGLSPDAEPSAAALDRLKRVIREEGVTTVFTEPLAAGHSADALARSAGVQVAELDPIEGPASEDDSGDYLELMRRNLAALQEANGC